MATEDHKYQPVREGSEEIPSSEGEWEYFVHDCNTPTYDEIEARAAAVGTIWKCGHCANRWKLATRNRNGGQAFTTRDDILTWIRITPIKDDEKGL